MWPGSNLIVQPLVHRSYIRQIVRIHKKPEPIRISADDLIKGPDFPANAPGRPVRLCLYPVIHPLSLLIDLEMFIREQGGLVITVEIEPLRPSNVGRYFY
jgi:hypothetical protein